MTTEQQSLAWACLPKCERNKIISAYACNKTSGKQYNMGYSDALRQLYGEHNLTSDTKLEEMLMVSRKEVIRIYKESNSSDDFNAGIRNCLEELFGDKCLPDAPNTPNSGELKTQVTENKSKFSKGERVKIINVANSMMRDEIGIIEELPTAAAPLYKVRYDEENCTLLEAKYLEPYTEENTEPMGDKTLNLCEQLAYQDLSGAYSPIYGEVKVTDIACDCLVITPIQSSDNNIELFPDGRFSKNGDCLLFPSRALYEKYPLDAYSAWMEWEKSSKSKVELRVSYVIKRGCLNGCGDFEPLVFHSDEEAKQAADGIREYLKKFHETHQK